MCRSPLLFDTRSSSFISDDLVSPLPLCFPRRTWLCNSPACFDCRGFLTCEVVDSLVRVKAPAAEQKAYSSLWPPCQLRQRSYQNQPFRLPLPRSSDSLLKLFCLLLES